MPRKTDSRVVLNRKALNELAGAMADGLAEMGRTVIEETNPPDAPTYGVGLVTTGDWGVWAGTKKVSGTAQKPRGERLDGSQVTLLAGFDFPARFQEMGTVHQPARPFFTPVILRVAPDAGPFIKTAVGRVDRGRR